MNAPEATIDHGSLAPGRHWPLGASVEPAGEGRVPGVNFAVWAPEAEALELCVFDPGGHRELRRLAFPACRDGVWHGRLEGAGAGLVYGLRAHGPWAPARGLRFNPAKLLLDPWAREVVGRYGCDADGRPADFELYRAHRSDDPDQADPRDDAAVALKARVCDELAPFPWDGDRPPHHPAERLVLYEVHVKGATRRHPLLSSALRGTYAGLAHPAFIHHLRRLGVNALSLMPVHVIADEERLQRLGLVNYWGYSSIGYFAPEPRYAAAPLRARDEFRAMVRDLHRAGIEVILDVVFNHTAETDENGPTLSFRGLGNRQYYVLEPTDPRRYANWSGCGNCLDLAQPRVVELVVGALRHWVDAMHVDGFRFDLAPVLARGPRGYTHAAGFFAALQADPVLARVRLIAEPWDIGPGGYQLGNFPPGWKEWNDLYRDGMRRFWLHDGRGPGITLGEFARRFAGSSDRFGHDHRRPTASVNYVAAHDGFTLRDLVSYARRHNQANGEGNHDGHADEHGWNCGVEGPSDDPQVQALRARLQRALLATVLLSQGTPMLQGGDEIGRSQDGNNNAYCQDNATTWLDWIEADLDLAGFVARVLALRQRQAVLHAADWLGAPGSDSAVTADWRAPDGRPLQPQDWERPGAGTLALRLASGHDATGQTHAEPVLILVNAEAHACMFNVPGLGEGRHWQPRLCSDTPHGRPTCPSPWADRVELPPRSLWLAVAASTPPPSSPS